MRNRFGQEIRVGDLVIFHAGMGYVTKIDPNGLATVETRNPRRWYTVAVRDIQLLKEEGVSSYKSLIHQVHAAQQKRYRQESVSRFCEIWLDNKGQWWLDLANREYGDEDDATTYGPFRTEDDADDYIRNFSNPGGLSVDDSGRRPPPKRSPNGAPIERPRRGYRW